MGRCVQVKCGGTSPIDVFVVNKHDLSVTIGMGYRQDVNTVHLFQKFTHV